MKCFYKFKKCKELEEKQLNDEIEELKKVYQLAIQARDFEITNLVHRNNFYMLFQGVLLASALSTQAQKPYVELVICLCGIFVSFFQFNASVGAKYWQEYWEIKVDNIERKLQEIMGKDRFIRLFQLYDKEFHNKVKSKIIKNNSCILSYFICRKPSVSKQPIYTALVLLLIWLVLFLQTINLAILIDLKLSSLIEGFSFNKTP